MARDRDRDGNGQFMETGAQDADQDGTVQLSSIRKVASANLTTDGDNGAAGYCQGYSG